MRLGRLRLGFYFALSERKTLAIHRKDMDGMAREVEDNNLLISQKDIILKLDNNTLTGYDNAASKKND